MNKKNVIYLLILLGIILNFAVDINIKNYIKILNICFQKNISLSNNFYILICVIIAIISIFIIVDVLLVIFLKQSENKGIKFKLEDGTYGTSYWMNESKINEVLGKNDIPGIILGKFNNDIIKLPFESYFNKNICVFGSSR